MWPWPWFLTFWPWTLLMSQLLHDQNLLAKTNNLLLGYSDITIENLGAVSTTDFTVGGFQSLRCLQWPITQNSAKSVYPRLRYFRGAPMKQSFSEVSEPNYTKLSQDISTRSANERPSYWRFVQFAQTVFSWGNFEQPILKSWGAT